MSFPAPPPPAQAGVQHRAGRNWTPAFGVPAKYYFAGCPFAGVVKQ